MHYVTSDLHGYPLDSFLRLLESAGFGDSDCLYVLGDVVDRNGDGGIAALRWIMSRPNVEFLLGNHEDMLLSCVPFLDEIREESIRDLQLEQMQHLLRWLRNGANPTILSLQALKRNLPDTFEELVEFLRRAPLYMNVSAGGRDFLLVHSGLGGFSPERRLSDYAPDELLWTRPPEDQRYFADITTIFGHTPTGYMYGTRGRMFRTDTWINIDTGAAAGGSPMLLRLEDMREFYADE